MKKRTITSEKQLKQISKQLQEKEQNRIIKKVVNSKAFSIYVENETNTTFYIYFDVFRTIKKIEIFND